MLPSLSLLVLLTVAPADEPSYTNDTFGLSVALPEGWVVDERVAGESSLQVVFSPPATPTVQLTIVVRPGTPKDPEAMRALSRSAVDADPMYTNPREVVRSVAGREVPGLLIDAVYLGMNLLLRQAYVVENGVAFVIQDFAPVADLPALTDTIDGIWNDLQFTEVSGDRQAHLDLLELAAHCGSEIDWAESWEDAVARSKAERRPILLAARMYAGFAISDARMIGDFMDLDTIALLNERYVPLDVGKQDVGDLPLVDPDVYGMGPNTFGQATLVVTPDGEVLDEANPLTDEFLRASTGLDPDLPGPPMPEVDDLTERAELHYRRGELDRVFELLAEPTTAAQHQLLYRTHVRLRQGDRARVALWSARLAPGADALATDLLVDEAQLLILLGEEQVAAAMLDHVLSHAPEHERVPEVILTRGVLHYASGDRSASETALRRAIDEHTESRWAWLAAGLMTSSGWEMTVPTKLDWPSDELWASIAQPTYEPLANHEASRAERDATDWLLRNQQADGSWIALGEVGRTDEQPPHHFELAATSICAQGLIPHREDADVEAALQRGLDWVLAAYAEAREKGEPAFYLDYTCWSRAYLLDFLAAATGAGLASVERLEPSVRLLLDELGELQKPAGGWSYYVTGDLENTDNPTFFAMSFTTAAIVLSLLHAREVGFDVPDGLVEGGLDTLERARLDDVFTYMVHPPEASTPRPLRRAGSAGRGPVCALALYRGGRTDLQEVRSALDVFAELRGGLSAELGKNLMHTGPEGQGSHYLMFDYRNAAAAVSALPAEEQPAYREIVLEDILRARTVEGAYVDNPLNSRALGAGMALLAFRDLLADLVAEP